MLGNSRTWKMHSVRRTPVALESMWTGARVPNHVLLPKSKAANTATHCCAGCRSGLRLAPSVCAWMMGITFGHRAGCVTIVRSQHGSPKAFGCFLITLKVSSDHALPQKILVAALRVLIKPFMSMLGPCFVLPLFIQSHAGHLRQDHSKTLGQASKLPV